MTVRVANLVSSNHSKCDARFEARRWKYDDTPTVLVNHHGELDLCEHCFIPPSKLIAEAVPAMHEAELEDVAKPSSHCHAFEKICHDNVR